MTVALFLKAHVKGYTRKDGTFVKEHTTKVIAKPQEKPAPKQPPKKPETTGAKKPAAVAISVSSPAALSSKHVQIPFGAKWTPGKKEKTAGMVHPKADDKGKPFVVDHPSTASPAGTWENPKKTAVFTPGGETPDTLNGIPFSAWSDHPRTIEGWEFVAGQMHDLEEPELDTRGKAPAAGVIIEEPDGRVWMVKPSNGFAGYKTTFPKGHADDGISLQATAIKEAFEESGLQVEITGLVGDVERTETVTRYYRARRVGGTPAEMGWESQAVVLAPKSEIHTELNRDVDRTVATLAGIKAPATGRESIEGWERTGKALGSNPGGFFKDQAGQSWYVKLPKSENIAKNEVLAGKLYEAAGVRVPELKLVNVDGKTGIASKVMPGLSKLTDGHEHVEGIMDGFAVDAWLANWDVVGLLHDNLLADEHGRAVRVDVGGSLVYRAQGEPKGKLFGDEVGELETLTNGMNEQSASVFGGITHDELVAGINKVKAVSEAKIRALTEQYGPGTPEQRGKLADRLIARRAYLLSLA